MNNFVNLVFDLLVLALIDMSKAVGMTYKQLNILIFCLIEPLAYIVMLWVIIKQHFKIKSLKNEKVINC